MTDEKFIKELYATERYDVETCCEYPGCQPMIKDPDGDYILFTDCERLIDKLLQEVERLRNETSFLQNEVMRLSINDRSM